MLCGSFRKKGPHSPADEYRLLGTERPNLERIISVQKAPVPAPRILVSNRNSTSSLRQPKIPRTTVLQVLLDAVSNDYI